MGRPFFVGLPTIWPAKTDSSEDRAFLDSVSWQSEFYHFGPFWMLIRLLAVQKLTTTINDFTNQISLEKQGFVRDVSIFGAYFSDVKS